MEKEMKLTIHIKTMDMFRFMMRHFYTGFSGIFGILISAGALVLLVKGIGERTPEQMLILGIFACLFTVFQPIQFLMKSHQQISRLPVYKEPIQYVLNESGIHVAQKEENLSLPWEKIFKVIEVGSALYVYTSPVHAFIYPKVQMEGQVEQVKSLLRECMPADKLKLKK